MSAELLSGIESLNYQSMTPIQAQGLPLILEGQDVMAQAKTGSGKTAAFAIGLLNRLEAKTYQTQALVLCPTRELADQVSNAVRQLARAIPNIKILSLCGGKPMGPQLASLERSPHIVIGTPGRVLKHLDKGSLNLSRLSTLVLDEADRMLDMGFLEDMMRIIDRTPRQRQTLLFSATFAHEIKAISQSIQRNPVDIQAETLHDNTAIKQVFYEIPEHQRSQTLVALLKHYQPASTLVFCNRKQQCQALADELRHLGFHALALHGDLEQYERDQVLVQFSNNSCSILIATDVAARGLDVEDLGAVINYDLTPDPEIHIHRIGRTGRAGKQGLAISLVTAGELFRLKAIEQYQDSPVQIESTSALKAAEAAIPIAEMVTFCIAAGRKQKLRKGDILGALTANTDLPAKQVGKINLFDNQAYVAVKRSVARQALKILSGGKIKGRSFKVRKLD